MQYGIILLFIWFIGISAEVQSHYPDLTKKEDLKALGIGKIIEKDRSIITRITLDEVQEFGIVYIKDESLHDMAIDKIARIEFNRTKWGKVVIEFNKGKAHISVNENEP